MKEPRSDSDAASALARSARIEHLNRRYRTALTRFFSSRSRRPDDIEDLVQEVFVRLIARGGLDDVRVEENDLFVAAGIVWRDAARKDVTRHRDRHASLADHHLPVDAISPEVVAVGKEDLRRALMAIQELPLRTQAIFALQRYEQLTYSQIARRLGVSVNAVEKHMMKAIAIERSRANGSERKCEHSCADFAHAPAQIVELNQQSSPSISGATANLYEGCCDMEF